MASHLLAELFAVLTRLPARAEHGSPTHYRQRTRALHHYLSAIERMVDWSLAGGAMYDALHVQAALSARADELHTFNGADFRRIWPDAGDRLVVLA